MTEVASCTCGGSLIAGSDGWHSTQGCSGSPPRALQTTAIGVLPTDITYSLLHFQNSSGTRLCSIDGEGHLYGPDKNHEISATDFLAIAEPVIAEMDTPSANRAAVHIALVRRLAEYEQFVAQVAEHGLDPAAMQVLYDVANGIVKK